MNLKYYYSSLYKILLVGLLYIVSAGFIYASQIKVDSLWNALDHTQNEVERLKIRIAIEDLLAKIPVGERRPGASTKLFSIEMDIDIIEKHAKENTDLLPKAYEYDGVLHYINGNISKAIEQMQKALESTQISNKKWIPLRWLGLFYQFNGELAKCIETFESCIHFAKEYYEEDDEIGNSTIYALHSAQIPSLINIGDSRSAIKVANQSLRYAKLSKDSLLITDALIDQVKARVHTSTPDSLVNELKEELYPLIKQDNDDQLYSYYSILSYIYLQAQNYELASHYLEKAQQVDAFGKHNFHDKQLLGGTYLGSKRYKEATKLFIEVINYYKETAPSSFNLAHAYSNLSLCYYELGKIADSKKYILLALDVPMEMSQDYINSKASLTKIYWKYFEETKNQLYVDSTISNMIETDQLISELRLKRKSYEDFSDINERIFNSYSIHLEVLSKLDSLKDERLDNEMIFKYITDLKAHSLLEQLKTDGSVIVGNMPDSILTKEKAYKYELNKLEEKIFQLKRIETDEEKLEDLKISLDLKKEKYYGFLDQVEKHYPNYYRHQYQKEKIKLIDLQNDLNPKEASILYFVDENTCYVLLIEKNKVSFINYPLEENWENSILNLRKLLSDPNSKVETFEEISLVVFDKFLKIPLENVSEDIQYLKFIKDAQLSFIPFEVLCTQKKDKPKSFKDLYYLMNDFTISYAPSALYSIKRNRDQKHKIKWNYSGYAPEYSFEKEEVHSRFSDLPFARKSVNKIAKSLGGKSFLSSNASINQFQKIAPHSNIIHLAMHGNIDLNEPMLSNLVFNKNEFQNLLYASDIMDMNFNSELIVLSACNTGIGKLVQGDGIQNLSKAFAFSGISNILMTLWSVPDVQTALIDELFFDDLKNGKRIDDALLNAKKTFLKTMPENRSHPFYWSAYIASGEMLSISFYQSNNIYYYFLMFFALIIVVLFFYYKKNSSSINLS